MKKIFPLEDTSLGSNITAKFTLVDSIAHIQSLGLREGDTLLVESEFWMGECEDPTWVPFVWCGHQTKVSYPSNNLMLAVPGTYRIAIINDDGEHLVDSTYFENVRVNLSIVSVNHNLDEFYSNCCCSDPSPCEVISKLPVTTNIGG